MAPTSVSISRRGPKNFAHLRRYQRRANGSNRHESQMVHPFLGTGRFPDQQQVFDSSAYIKVLRHDYETRTRSGLPKPRASFFDSWELGQGRIPRLCCARPGRTVVSTLEINGRFPAAKTGYDLVVEIGIRLEPQSHAPGI
jgi:hypothetical protein